MLTPTSGGFKIIPTQSLHRFKDIGFKFFDDDKNVYVSPKTFEHIATGELKLLRYIILSWNSTATTIDAVANDLNNRMLSYKSTLMESI